MILSLLIIHPIGVPATIPWWDSRQDSTNSLQRAQIQSLVGELRSHEPQIQKNIVSPIKLGENKLILHIFKKLFE